MLIANLERFEKEVYEKGIEEGIVSSVKKLLIKGFSDEEIIDLLEVNKDVIDKVKENSVIN